MSSSSLCRSLTLLEEVGSLIFFLSVKISAVAVTYDPFRIQGDDEAGCKRELAEDS